MSSIEPPSDCALCPRLVEFRSANRQAFPAFHNGPVRAFGPLDSRLLIVGLAPGLKGANQTGRPFTGDYAGDLLYQTLGKFGFAEGTYGRTADDGLVLKDCRITNAVRCVPPENKPIGSEGQNCRPFLATEIEQMDRLQVILCLGGLSHAAVLTTLSARKVLYPFGHGRLHRFDRVTIADSYHCSRYNTNTGRLTVGMFEEVFGAIRQLLITVPKQS
ncbi:uracil-DNA glycosylase [Pelagibius litoralis]|uniref:Type-5 uracil-DNA glycosylase n=1 Tax=Pelagibius litoralis TaxID=374515 RepID=A0A967C2N8_9PROT|nr:uracil-DNA glycosylase [Pelagibius litoralis]NIA66990.1 uracil-DNA glycosylase [Pelagibius litoralis]